MIMIKRLLLGLLRIYKVAISPFLGPACRFYPSCSSYAAQAVQLHGAARGSWLAAKRLARCHPFSSGGYDPVPGAGEDDPETGKLAASADFARDHDQHCLDGGLLRSSSCRCACSQVSPQGKTPR